MEKKVCIDEAGGNDDEAQGADATANDKEEDEHQGKELLLPTMIYHPAFAVAHSHSPFFDSLSPFSEVVP